MVLELALGVVGVLTTAAFCGMLVVIAVSRVLAGGVIAGMLATGMLGAFFAACFGTVASAIRVEGTAAHGAEGEQPKGRESHQCLV